MSAEPDQLELDENGRPIWILRDADAEHEAALAAAEEARRYRKVGRLQFRLLPGFKAPRPKRKRKLAGWLANGMTRVEAGGWKGIANRWSFIAYEMARERGHWGKRTHDAFIVTLDIIASKSPELRDGKGRSRIAYGRAAEHAWQHARANKAAQRSVLRGKMPQLVFVPPGGVASATCSRRRKINGDIASVVAEPASSLAELAALAAPAGGVSADDRHHPIVCVAIPTVAFRSKTRVAKRAVADIRAWCVDADERNLDPIAVGYALSRLAALWGMGKDRKKALRRANRYFELGLISRLCDGLCGHGGKQTRGDGRGDAENAIYCLPAVPGEAVAPERIAEGLARGHVQAQVARVARKLAERAAADEHFAHYEHEWIAGVHHCVERATAVATVMSIAHPPEAAVAPEPAQPTHDPIPGPTAPARQFSNKDGRLVDASGRFIDERGLPIYSAAERRTASDILTAAWSVIREYQYGDVIAYQDSEMGTDVEISAHTWRDRNASMALDFARAGWTPTHVANLLSDEYDSDAGGLHHMLKRLCGVVWRRNMQEGVTVS